MSASRDRLCSLLLAGLALLLCSCTRIAPRPGSASEAVRSIDFACEGGSSEKIERWGAAGASRGCYRDGKRDGRFVFWEEGYLNLEGFYSDGEKDGTWTVFNGDGSTFVEIVFEKGVKKSKTYH
jgi:hypothetical protein